MAAIVLAIVDDLFFLAKIRETAKAVGATIIALDPKRGAAGVAEARPQAILLDLNSRTLPAVEWIRTLKSDPATRPISIVGFISHVQTDLISAARAAGCDVVLARSAFTQQLPDLLRRLADPTSAVLH
jgi:CheY-like chemotaxis protein